jgi:pimeloyl-ACP methyl ester carboxylesterase
MTRAARGRVPAALGALVAALLLAATAGAARPGTAAPPPQGNTLAVTLRTSDGVAIAATVYLPSRRPAPAVVLLHMLGRSRDDWQAAGVRLSEAGFVGLAIDLRGHGASGVRAEDTTADLSRDLLDVRAARGYLKSHPDISTDRVGMAGASIGANLAVLAAADDPTVRSLALLSAGLEYRGLRTEAAMKKYNERPALIVVSQEDPYALRSAKALAAAGGGIREMLQLDGAGHGTVMLTRRPDLIGTLVEWFQRTLL